MKKSAIFRRIVAALNIDILNRIEDAKPDNIIKFTHHVNIKDPDLSSPSLPLELPYILRDLDTIRTVNEKLGSTFIMCSYGMLLNNTVCTDGIKYAGVYSWWMEQFGPVKLKELEMLNGFQNLVFKKYSEQYGLKFIDVAKELPRAPEGFVDGVHLNCEGMKYHAWIVFLDLLPLIEEKINNGEFPRQSQFNFTEHPYIKENFNRMELPYSCN